MKFFIKYEKTIIHFSSVFKKENTLVMCLLEGLSEMSFSCVETR